MLAVTNTALNLLVLELLFQIARVGLLLLGVLTPIRTGPEYDVLADGCCVLNKTYCEQRHF